MRTYAMALLSGLILLVGGISMASAENASERPPAGRLEPRDSGSGAGAPAGHRQPQAKEPPAGEMPPADAATRDFDKALEKKLTICRGC
jgi:hypothetical protein